MCARITALNAEEGEILRVASADGPPTGSPFIQMRFAHRPAPDPNGETGLVAITNQVRAVWDSVMIMAYRPDTGGIVQPCRIGSLIAISRRTRASMTCYASPGPGET